MTKSKEYGTIIPMNTKIIVGACYRLPNGQVGRVISEPTPDGIVDVDVNCTVYAEYTYDIAPAMKEFSYYSEIKAEYPDRLGYKKKLTSDINNEKLTHVEREEKLKAIPQLVNEWFTNAVKPYTDESRKKEAQFYLDASVMIGYCDWPLEIKQKLQYQAYEDGHSAGYSEVFGYLQKYYEFVNDIRTYLGRGKTKIDTKVVVSVEGGVVKEIRSNDPHIRVKVVDYDEDDVVNVEDFLELKSVYP